MNPSDSQHRPQVCECRKGDIEDGVHNIGCPDCWCCQPPPTGLEELLEWKRKRQQSEVPHPKLWNGPSPILDGLDTKSTLPVPTRADVDQMHASYEADLQAAKIINIELRDQQSHAEQTAIAGMNSALAERDELREQVQRLTDALTEIANGTMRPAHHVAKEALK